MKTYFITGHKNSSIRILKTGASEDSAGHKLDTDENSLTDINNGHHFNNNVEKKVIQNGTKSLPSLG